MHNKFKDISLFGKREFAVIGIHFDVVTTYEVLIVNKNVEELSVISSFRTNDYEEIKDKVKTSIPILLHFSGKGILIKKVAAQGNYLKEILFNASPEDFYIYETHQDTFKFVSIARKNVLDFVFTKFKNDKYLVIDYSIGPFASLIIKNIINEPVIMSGDYELTFANDLMVDYSKTNVKSSDYILGKEKINNGQVPLFSTLLLHLYPSDLISYEHEFLIQNKQEFKLKKIFDSALIFVGLFFLISLMTSYFLLNHYNNKYLSYESQLYNLNHTYNQVKSIEIEKQNKISILQESGILKQNFISYYIFKVVSIIPEGINLNSLKVNPNIKKVKNFEKIEFETNAILIQGNSENSLPVNTWVKSLKLENWISKIEILDFSKSRKKRGQFTIKIIIK